MINNILSAYYFNPLKPKNMPWNETMRAYTLRWLVKGKVDFEINSNKIQLLSGQIVICPPGSDITMNVDKVSDVIYSVTTFEGDLSFLKSIPLEVPITLSTTEGEQLLQYFYTATQYYNDGLVWSDSESVRRYAVSLLETFLLRLDVKNSKFKKMLFQQTSKTATQANDQKITFEIKQYLMEHISESISLTDLSESLGVSVNTAMHVFRNNVGMGIIAYFNKLKIEKAMQLIDEGKLSFRTISERLGFESPEYFSRVFKKQTGMTPTDYAKQQSKWSGCLASLFM
jgi:AraC-like DNA-binding protein